MIDEILSQIQFQEVDIIKKCKKYGEFKKELEQLQQNYEKDLNEINLINMQKQDNGKCFTIAKRDKIYVNFYGYQLQKLNQNELMRVYLLWISKMDKEIRKNKQIKYTVIYYHSMTNSSDSFNFIRDSYKKLPILYYVLLDKIYVVSGNIFIKAAGLLSFGRLYKLYAKRIIYVQNLDKFYHIQEIFKNQIVQSLPEQYLQGEELKNIQLTKINSIKTNAKKIQKKDCFCILLSEHKVDQNGLPIYLMILILTMRKNRYMMELQGIFRKSGSIQQQQQIIQQLSAMNKVEVLKQVQNRARCGYAIAGVIKKFFTKLLQPLFSYEVYNYIMDLKNIRQQDELILVNTIINSLQRQQKKIFLYVIKFIKIEILKYKKNKMNQNSMAIIFSPCFFRSKSSTFHDLLNSGKYAWILNIIFKKYDEIQSKQQNVVGFMPPTSKDKRESKESKQSKQSKGSKGSRGSGKGELKQKNTNIL